MRVPEIVGYRLRERREELGWTQAELAEHLEAFIGRKWFVQAVSAAEKGSRDFTAEEIFGMAFALQVDVAYLFQPPPGTKTIEFPGSKLNVRPEKERTVRDELLEARRILNRVIGQGK